MSLPVDCWDYVKDGMDKYTWSVAIHNDRGFSTENPVEVYAFTKEGAYASVCERMRKRGYQGDGIDFFVQHLIPTPKSVY